MNTHPHLMQQLVNHHSAELLAAAERARLARAVRVAQPTPRPRMAWLRTRRPALRPAAAH